MKRLLYQSFGVSRDSGRSFLEFPMQILSGMLGGRCSTVVISTVSPSEACIDDTLVCRAYMTSWTLAWLDYYACRRVQSTIGFATKARQIANTQISGPAYAEIQRLQHMLEHVHAGGTPAGFDAVGAAASRSPLPSPRSRLQALDKRVALSPETKLDVEVEDFEA